MRTAPPVPASPRRATERASPSSRRRTTSAPSTTTGWSTSSCATWGRASPRSSARTARVWPRTATPPNPAISSDGRFVAFESVADKSQPRDDDNGVTDIYPARHSRRKHAAREPGRPTAPPADRDSGEPVAQRSAPSWSSSSPGPRTSAQRTTTPPGTSSRATSRRARRHSSAASTAPAPARTGIRSIRRSRRAGPASHSRRTPTTSMRTTATSTRTSTCPSRGSASSGT